MAMYRDGCIWQGEKVRLRAFELGEGGTRQGDGAGMWNCEDVGVFRNGAERRRFIR